MNATAFAGVVAAVVELEELELPQPLRARRVSVTPARAEIDVLGTGGWSPVVVGMASEQPTPPPTGYVVLRLKTP
jgi:hypothetical protein